MLPFSSERGERRDLLIIALLAVVQSAIVFAVSFRLAGNHFMFPLDDAYIHLQYARQLALGQPLVYTTGATPSGGMTSPLYVMLLSPLFILGLSGAKAAFGAWLLGTALWALSGVWLAQLARRLFGREMALVAAALLLGNGQMLWHYLSGMETGLAGTLLIAAVLGAWNWFNGEHRWAQIVLLLALALLPLARPEAVVVILATAAVVLLRRGARPRLSLLAVLATILPFLGWLAVLQGLTGNWKPAGMIVKSVLSAPDVDWATKFVYMGGNASAGLARYYFNIIPDAGWAAFKGTWFQNVFIPGFGVLVLVGFGFKLARELRTSAPAIGTLIALMWAGGFLAAMTGLFPFAHHQRYVAWLNPLAFLLACEALRRLSQLFQQLEQTASRALLILVVAASLPGLAFWAGEHGRNARDLYHLLRVATFSIEPSQRPMAITDAGILAFYTDRPIVDLVGLGSAEFAAAVPHGPGATLEVLSNHSGASLRPLELITYREWFDADFPLGPEVWAVAVPRTSIAWGRRLSRFELDWDAIDLGDKAPLPPGARLLAEVDVADLASERSAGYSSIRGSYDANDAISAWHLTPTVRFPVPEFSGGGVPTTGTLELALVEGGRVVRGEEFSLRMADWPQGPVTLALRASTRLPAQIEGPAPGDLEVRFTSSTTGASASVVVPLVEDDGGVFRVPVGPVLESVGGAAADDSGAAWRVTVRGFPDPTAPWVSCHYWLYQKDDPSLDLPRNGTDPLLSRSQRTVD